MPAAMGVRATMVPTLVPTLSEMKHEAMNKPASSICGGRRRSDRFTVASMAPIDLAVAAKAPARMKIQIMSKRLELPAPREKMSMRRPMFPLPTTPTA